VPVYQKLGQLPGVLLQIFFCIEREPNRLWNLPPLEFNHLFLRERYHEVNGRYIHNNPDVFKHLRAFAPDLVLTDGFNPTHLYGFGYAAFKGLPHVAMTDGTDVSEASLSKIHRAVRRTVFARTGAFISASDGGHRLYQSYGIPLEHCFKSCLCIDNDLFTPRPEDSFENKPYDFIFSGRIEEVKNPLFALQVAKATAERLGRKVSILFAGAGSLEDEMKSVAAGMADQVAATFNGYATQEALPALYRAARIFLFPTHWDPWGVVANEACAAGLPVIVTPAAGVAGELVVDGKNGFVCDLELDAWAGHAAALLGKPDMWQDFSNYSRMIVREYTFDTAALGILEACRFAMPAKEARNVKRTV
jgi:glycosyltransferase involved in cell wall biosynthesis